MTVNEPPDSQDTNVAGDVARRLSRERPALVHPDRIGPYRILQVLGEGGMGTVYEAEQTETIQRHVALKLIKLGMDTREVVARFEAERQALGVMDHPAIAKVLDGGATDEGRLYFVMELVHGVPLTTYCDQNSLSIRHRLNLFVELCHAVQHAHLKGVIHRDLKPSNVLVVEHDGKPSPKVIDFGVAKAVGVRAGMGFVTQLGQTVGTPAYMSPEQADASFTDVDTRSDVYSLGVILYELLVGALPVDWETMGAQTYLALLARYEVEPPTPSSRLTDLGDRQQDVTRKRCTSAASLRKELKGDLDWVVMKALDPDRVLRYETASALAADLQRYLAGEPVLAHAPSAAYALRKFVRRHRVGVAAASAVVLAAALGFAGATSGFVTARRERAVAQREAKTATLALDFLAGMFDEADPTSVPKSPGEAVTVAEILKRGSKRLETELHDEPLARARLLDAVGMANGHLGISDLAESQLREALALRRRVLGPDHLDVAESLKHWGSFWSRRGQRERALAAWEEIAWIYRKNYGPDHLEVGKALGACALHLSWNDADLPRARALSEQALAIVRKAPGHTERDVMNRLSSLALIARRQNDLEDAVSLHEEAIAIARKSVGPERLDLAKSLSLAADALAEMGDLAGDRSNYEEALEIRRQVLGPEHPQVASGLMILAFIQEDQGDIAAARQSLEQALEINKKVFGSNHMVIADGLRRLADVHMQQGDLAGALALGEQALGLAEGLGPAHPQLVVYRNYLVDILLARGDLPRARSLEEQSFAIQLEAGNRHELGFVSNLDGLAGVLRRQGDIAGATRCYEEAIDLQRTKGTHWYGLTRDLLLLGDMLAEQGDLAGARWRYEEALASRLRQLHSCNPQLVETLTGLGIIVRDQGELQHAEELLREALVIGEWPSGLGPTHAKTVKAREALVETLRRAGRGTADDLR